MSETEGQLDLLGMLHYVLGGMMCVFGLLPVLHIALGGFFLSGVMPAQRADDAVFMQFFGTMFIGIGMIWLVLAQACGVLMIFAGRKLRQRRGLMFCQIIAALECLAVPFGTALGVCSLIVLNKPEARALFTLPPISHP